MNEELYDRLKNLLANSKTQFHTVAECKAKLLANDFKEISMYDEWNFSDGGSFLVTPYPSVMVAFTIRQLQSKSCALRIAACHTDFPMIKLKVNPEMNKKGYLEANVEPYGGLIKQSFFDRPLGLAGKVMLAGENAFSPETRLIDSKKPVCIIPNLAPHLKRGDKETEIDVQKELIPIFDVAEKGDAPDKNWLMRYIGELCNANANEILDYDLYLYNIDEPTSIGMSGELFTSPRIDNVSSVGAILEGLIHASDSANSSYTSVASDSANIISVGAFFDNEEIGSRSKQGADSVLLSDIIKKIAKSLKIDDSAIYKDAFSISLDVAHGLHPNYMEKNDVTNDIILGQGVVLKSSASQRYVTDSAAGAVIESICRKYNIKLQRQVNRSGMPGGQTLGPIMSSYLPILSADMGIPVLAMHSASELAHKQDYIELVKLIKAFYTE